MPRCLAVLLLASTPAWAGAPTWADIQAVSSWEDVSTRNHDAGGTIQVQRATLGELPCFKGSATTTVAAEALYEVAADVESTLSWSSAGVTQAELLGKAGDTMEYFQYLDVPGWTFASDRFWFLKGTTVRNGGTIEFRWERLVDGGAHKARWEQVKAENAGAVEPPVNVGGWVFAPNGSSTDVSYFICTDTGGSIPMAVQSAATKRTLPDTVGELIGEAKKRSK